MRCSYKAEHFLGQLINSSQREVPEMSYAFRWSLRYVDPLLWLLWWAVPLTWMYVFCVSCVCMHVCRCMFKNTSVSWLCVHTTSVLGPTSNTCSPEAAGRYRYPREKSWHWSAEDREGDSLKALRENTSYCHFRSFLFDLRQCYWEASLTGSSKDTYFSTCHLFLYL